MRSSTDRERPDPVAAQHLALLNLTADGVADPFGIAADLVTAADAASEATRSGRLRRLTAIRDCSSDLATHPFYGALLAVGINLAEGEDDKAYEASAAAARAGNDTQRQAAAARFKQLAKKVPEVADTAAALASVLTEDHDGEPTAP